MIEVRNKEEGRDRERENKIGRERGGGEREGGGERDRKHITGGEKEKEEGVEREVG